MDFSPTVKMPLTCHPFHLRWLEPFSTDSSVQFSYSVVSNSLRPHGLQHTRPPCPSPPPRVYSNSCPLSPRCHPTISSCCPLLPPSIFPSIRVFSNESVLHIRWPKTVEAEKALAQKPRVLRLPTAEKEFIRILSG